MPLIITARLPGKHLATMLIGNVSEGLPDVSNYLVGAIEEPNPLTGLDRQMHEFSIVGHERRSSVWALVGKAAVQANAMIQAGEPNHAGYVKELEDYIASKAQGRN